jgi:hypothetical protein
MKIKSIYSFSFLFSFLFLLSCLFTGCANNSTSDGGGSTVKKTNLPDAVTSAKLTGAQSSMLLLNTNIMSNAVTIASKGNSNGVPSATVGAPVTQPSKSQGVISSLSVMADKGAVLRDSGNFGWIGPDADGWYTRSYMTGYGDSYHFIEKIRHSKKDLDVIAYKSTLSYNGADGSFELKIDSSADINGKGLYDGFYDIKNSSNGFQVIADAEFKFVYRDFDKKTGSGIFEWYVGSDSLGASYVPFHRYLYINAVDDVYAKMLDCHVTCYDGMGGNWTYSCPYNTFAIPDPFANDFWGTN